MPHPHSLHDATVTLVDGAIESLRQGTDEQAVHLARKSCKRVRAALRLLRAGLGEREYRLDNRRVRDSARPLTAVRDAIMLPQTLGRLTKHPQPLERDLEADYHRARQALARRGARTAIEQLRDTRARLTKITSVDCEVASAVAGAKSVYRAGRKALGKARSRQDKALHEWRKQSQYLLNQLELLRSIYNVGFKKLHRRAKRIAEALGDDHDLSVLSSKLRPGEACERPVGKHIEKRRRKLQARAFRHGKRLYRHSAKHFEGLLVAHLSQAQLWSTSARGATNGH